jgi:hypothetical protein
VNGPFLVDTCTLINFGVVDRMDLIRAALGPAARWVAAVEREARKSVAHVPSLDHTWCRNWLGEAIDVDEPADIDAVETLRLALGGTRRKPLQHLGEAQSLRVIATRPDLAGAIFVSDDASAVDLARRNDIPVWTTRHILRACYDTERIGCPEAYELLRDMRESHGRGVRVPPDHTTVCP